MVGVAAVLFIGLGLIVQIDTLKGVGALFALASNVVLIWWLMHMPIALLEFSPFCDFLMPGLILGILFGTGSFATFLALWFCSVWSFGAALTRFTGEHWSWSAAFAVGLGQMIWIATQMLMLRGLSWLHLVFGVLGLLIMLLTLEPGLRRYLAPGTIWTRLARL